jgi:hypothetical protein
MANVSRVNGFRAVRHLNGSPYNGQGNIYEVAAAQAAPIFIGDLVVLDATNGSTSGYDTVTTACGTNSNVSTAVCVGVVLGVFNSKVDIDGKMTTGSISLDIPIYRPASTKQFVLVADSPDLIFEAQMDVAMTLAWIGLNVGIGCIDITTGPLTTGASGQYIYGTTTPTSSTTRPLQILNVSKRVDNDYTSVNNKVLVRISTHAYGNAVAGA